MIALQVDDLNKSYGEQQVLCHASLVLQEKERVGLVGINGSGKSTLLACIIGDVEPDSGQIVVASGLALGCLEQVPAFGEAMTAWDAIMSSYAGLTAQLQEMRVLEARMGETGVELDRVMEQYARITEVYERAGGYACETIARRILAGLGFRGDEIRQPVSTFSGGQKTRLSLGCLLALAPDILLLDEPTNHLDLDSVEWLEDFVRTYRGTVLVVSHDRRFLDRVATRIIELGGGTLRSYSGNYSAFLQKKAAEDIAHQRAFEKQQAYIQKTEAYIRRFKAGIKSKQAHGRQLQLERLERLQDRVPERRLRARAMRVNQASGDEVLIVDGVSKSYGSQTVLRGVDLHLHKGEKIALIGPNGSGKTTLLKIISRQVEPDAGEIKLGSRVKIAFFSQEHEDLRPDRTVLAEIIDNFDLTLEEARTALGGMLFSADEVLKKVGDLSGGELGRLAFLKVMLTGANLLLLDEPTNHLDIPSCQAVETMLRNYPGTVLMVSHDRYFIDQVAERVAAVEDGRLEYYWGDYSYYHEKRLAREQELSAAGRESSPKPFSPDRRQRAEEKERLRVQRRLERELETLEQSIFAAESRKTDLEAQLSDPATYGDDAQVRLCSREYEQVKAILTEGYDRWEKLQEQMEPLAAERG
ncbi:MAG: ABC-F family ATP-binding cassette domain-containing protein [Syntrophomonadaceae bacterium]